MEAPAVRLHVMVPVICPPASEPRVSSTSSGGGGGGGGLVKWTYTPMIPMAPATSCSLS